MYSSSDVGIWILQYLNIVSMFHNKNISPKGPSQDVSPSNFPNFPSKPAESCYCNNCSQPPALYSLSAPAPTSSNAPGAVAFPARMTLGTICHCQCHSPPCRMMRTEASVFRILLQLVCCQSFSFVFSLSFVSLLVHERLLVFRLSTVHLVKNTKALVLLLPLMT